MPSKETRSNVGTRLELAAAQVNHSDEMGSTDRQACPLRKVSLLTINNTFVLYVSLNSVPGYRSLFIRRASLVPSHLQQARRTPRAESLPEVASARKRITGQTSRRLRKGPHVSSVKTVGYNSRKD